MKLEFNKQRIIGIAIVILFLLVAVPFLLAGNKKADIKNDDKVSLEIPASETKPEAQTSKSSAEVSDTKTPDDTSVEAEDLNSGSKTEDLTLPEDTSAKQSVQTSENSAIEDDIAIPRNTEVSSAGSLANSSEKTIATNGQQFAKNEVTTDLQNQNTNAEDNSKAMTSSVLIDNESEPTKNTATKKTTKKVYSSTSSTKPTKSSKVNQASVKVKTNKQFASNVKSKSATKKATVSDTSSVEPKKWIVRVGYHEKSDASKKILDTLHKKGYKNVYAKKTTVKGKEIINVFVGPMSTRKDAEKAADKLTKYLNKKVIVIKMK